jgi:anti-sigma B factor antagonist
MVIDIIHLSKRSSDQIKYDNVIFKINAADMLDADKTTDLYISTKTLVAGGAKKVLINMDNLDFIDSRGIGIIISIAKLVREKKGDAVLVAVPPHIERILQPVYLNRFMKIYAFEEDAVNYFKFM